MRFNTSQYLEKEVVTVSARNNRSSGVILDGQPIFLNPAGTNLGVDSILRGDTGAIDSLAVGIAKWSKLAGSSSQLSGAQVGDVFEAVAYGYTDAIITLRTRATSTDAWASNAAIAVGDQLVAGTVSNNLMRSGSLAAAAGNVDFIALNSQASQASAVSNAALISAATSDVADTIRMKVWVNCL